MNSRRPMTKEQAYGASVAAILIQDMSYKEKKALAVVNDYADYVRDGMKKRKSAAETAVSISNLYLNMFD